MTDSMVMQECHSASNLLTHLVSHSAGLRGRNIDLLEAWAKNRKEETAMLAVRARDSKRVV